MIFLDLGERKSKWKVMNTACTKTNKKKAILYGWKAEARGGHDFQFFNNEKLDELEKIEEKWNNYHINQQKIKEIIESQTEKEDFEKIINIHEFLTHHAKNIYNLINLINPNILNDSNIGDSIEEKDVSKDIDEDGNEGYKKSGEFNGIVNIYSKSNVGSSETRNNDSKNSGSKDMDNEFYKNKIIKLLETKKKLNMIKFREKNVKSCYEYMINFIKKNLVPNSNGDVGTANNNNKKNKNKKVKKDLSDDISTIDIEEIKIEKQKLLKQGFAKWNKAEFNKLMSALIIHGCDNLDYIYEKYFLNSKKSMEDIKSYLKVFFRKYDQVKGGIRLFEKIRNSDLQKQIIQEENDMIANYVEKQLSNGVDTIDKLELPPNFRYENVYIQPESVNTTGGTNDVPEKVSEEEILYFERENKILLWLLYQEGVVQTKSIHILTPYYWAETYNFFKYATTPLENIEYRCRLIVDAIMELNKKNVKSSNSKERRRG
ncbi:hypothetical protein YYC_04746 [Plasmodium yoelii 17X]|uniref:SANT domain-containing protein n=1 Tax=Plasmodium yoelii 17X TaxID=1323249 RepID=V7PGR3_PLAYE|nr:hypothetical protein YYC_04746 [Plasmodium yoelii 17X]